MFLDKYNYNEYDEYLTDKYKKSIIYKEAISIAKEKIKEEEEKESKHYYGSIVAKEIQIKLLSKYREAIDEIDYNSKTKAFIKECNEEEQFMRKRVYDTTYENIEEKDIAQLVEEINEFINQAKKDDEDARIFIYSKNEAKDMTEDFVQIIPTNVVSEKTDGITYIKIVSKIDNFKVKVNKINYIYLDGDIQYINIYLKQ